MRRTGSRIAPRKPSAARISDTIGSPRRSGIRTSPIARRPRQIGLIIGWSGAAVESTRRMAGSAQRYRVNSSVSCTPGENCKALVDAELEVEGAVLMAQHDGGRHRRFARPQGHDLALAGLGQRRGGAANKGRITVVLAER